MTHQVFIPVTDDLIYNHPEQIEGPLVPYSAGVECHHWLSIELNPEDDDEVNLHISKTKPANSPSKTDHSHLHLAYSQ